MKYQKYLDKHRVDLTNKTILVTGANSGIGYWVTLQLCYYNAHVIMGCRNLEKALLAKESILLEVPNAKIDIEIIDLGNTESVLNFVTLIKDKYKSIDILVNNAGVYFSENTMLINYIGPYILTTNLISIIKEKVVNVSSVAHYFGKIDYNDFLANNNKSRAYANSKLALHSLNIALSPIYPNLTFINTHPGLTATNILKSPNNTFFVWLKKLGSSFMKVFSHSPEKAALTTLLGIIENNDSYDFYGPRGLFHLSGYPKKQKQSKKAFKHINELINVSNKFI
jgi:NAD(P)-dependent dehydrogenase (short-subunit alcohol dehydrogenase family)